MPGYMDPSFPLQKLTEITKRLRSRDVPLLSLLPFARSLLKPQNSRGGDVYFPQKEEWLLEWVVQRLREEDDAETLRARCNPEIWKFILHLLPSSTSADLILKKHSILQVISKTFSDAALLPTLTMSIDLSVDTQINEEGEEGEEDLVEREEEESRMSQEIVSSTISSSTESGLAVTWKLLLRLQELLKSISAVLLYLQGNWTAGSREGNVVAVLRGTPEIGAQILGSYLEACQHLAQNEIELEKDWTSAVVNIWRNCVWGNPNLKKVSLLFSTFCLVPATRLMLAPFTTSYLRREIEQLITEFIFTYETPLFVSSYVAKSTKPSSKDLKQLVGPLKIQKEGLPHIFKIGIIASQTKRKKPDTDTVEAIFDSVTSGVLEVMLPADNMSDLDAEIIAEILEVLVDTSTMVSSETLAKLVDSISNLSRCEQGLVRWNIIATALKLDFGIFLDQGNEVRRSDLINALTKTQHDKGIIFEIFELLINGFVKARDLEGFANIWARELGKEEVRGGIWESDIVANIFSDRVEKALLPGQIDKILRTACQHESWIVVDAVLRGVWREETEDKILGSLLEIAESILKGNGGWRGWRTLARASQINNSLGKNARQSALEAIRQPRVDGIGGQAKQILFASEVLMDGADINSQVDVLSIAVQAILNAQRCWDGSVSDVDEETLGVAMMTSFTGRWLGVVELAPSDTRTEFVDGFLNIAMRGIDENGKGKITSRGLWFEMLSNGEFYEYSALKDALIAALITKLEGFLGVLEYLKTSLKDNLGDRSDSIERDSSTEYEFVLDSIAKYPLEAIKRVARERILDTLVVLDARLRAEQKQKYLGVAVRELVKKLWNLGNTRSFLARDATGFIGWVLGGEEETGRRILRYVLATKEQEKSQKFLVSLVALAEESFCHEGQIEVQGFSVCQIIVEEFWQSGSETIVKQLRDRVLQKLRKLIMAEKANGQQINAWRRIWILERTSENINEALGLAYGIIENFKTILPKILTPGGNLGRAVNREEEEATKVIAETVMLLCACSRTGKEVVNTTALTVSILDSPIAEPCKPGIMAAYRYMISGILNPPVYLECLRAVIRGCFALTDEEPVLPGYWEVLKIVVDGAKKPDDNEASKNVTASLSAVFSKLAWNLPRVKTTGEFLNISDCMVIILREKPWAMMQYNIDETFTSIAITASPSGPRFYLADLAADEIIVRLCNLSQATLTLHRRRVRGSRYHLVIAALQSILHCIHKRKMPGERKKSDQIVHPPWLLTLTPACNRKTNMKPINMPRITERCADGFNRLVIIFCEPTASSVRERTRKKIDDSLVNSVRDREKREVASCVGSLLGEMLKGRLEGGFQGDITPSISAIFGVLGPEGVKAFAKTVDREGRAMLRGLWDEYNRVGGGTGEKL